MATAGVRSNAVATIPQSRPALVKARPEESIHPASISLRSWSAKTHAAMPNSWQTTRPRLFYKRIHSVDRSQKHYVEDFANDGPDDQAIHNRTAIEEFLENVFPLLASGEGNVVGDDNDYLPASRSRSLTHLDGRIAQGRVLSPDRSRRSKNLSTKPER